MKRFFKLFTCFLTMFFVVSPVFSKSILKENPIDSLIKSSELAKTATIAVSVRDVKSGDVVYSKDADKLLHPASTLKLVSTPAAIGVLGKDYCFKTQFFVDSNKNLYVKLGADPMLSSSDLKGLVKMLKSNNIKSLNSVYIDDSIVDKAEWGIGWMWDDETNPLMPKFSAYNLDDNILKIEVAKNESDSGTTVSLKSSYPVAIINNVKVGNSTNIESVRYNWQSSDIIELYGTVASSQVISVPISNMRRYFVCKLGEYFNREGIVCANENFSSSITPAGAKLLGEISHGANSLVPAILKNSNNKASETLCKVAGSKLNNSTGTNYLTAKMIKDYYIAKSVPVDEVVIVDASGVSRNNLVSANWMSLALTKIAKSDDFSFIQENMAQPGDGTMVNRLYDLRGSVWLKTGTISNVSAVSGFVNAKNGKVYAVSIMIQNFINPQKEAKQLENSIITQIYNQ